MNPERILKLILRINGVVMATAVFAVFLPADWMATIHDKWLGLEPEFPNQPIVIYLARSLSAFYAMMGILYLILARDVRVYAPVISFMAWASLCFGAATIIIDLQLDFPAWWIWGESPYIIAYGVAVLWLQAKMKSDEHEENN
jgi:hypothetical protein